MGFCRIEGAKVEVPTYEKNYIVNYRKDKEKKINLWLWKVDCFSAMMSFISSQ